MARYVFEEEGSRKFWEVEVSGSEVTTRWGRVGTVGKSKQKAFASADAARREQDKLVAEKLRKGYAPAEPDRASEVAPSGKKPEAMKAFRRDVFVDNEATGFLVTSPRLRGRGEKEWDAAVRSGDLLPIPLVQDDSFVIRVVAGGELTAAESEEWVGRLAWRLRVPDGKMVIAGGVEFVLEPRGEDDDGLSDYVRVLELPRGEYRAELYAYLHGVDGERLVGRAAKGRKAEPAGSYFRRTRPGEEFPVWLRRWCIAHRSTDPGHEDEWKGQTLPENQPEHVDFLLHLTLDEGVPLAMPALKRGLFSFEAFDVRKPERCPLGIVAQDVMRPEPKAPPEPPPVRTVDVHALVASHELVPVSGGPVGAPIARPDRAFCLAWFATDAAHPELRITLPVGASFTPSLEGLEGAAVSSIEGGCRVGFAKSEGKWTAFDRVRDLGGRLTTLAEGSVLELATCDPEPGGKPLLGLVRFRGPVHGGVWRIAEAFPAVSADRLGEALALAAASEDGEALALSTPEEARTVLARLMREFGFLVKDNPVAQDGAVLRVSKRDTFLVAMMGVETFRLRYADTWVMPEPREGGDIWDTIIARVAGVAGMTEGELILEGEGGRRYHGYDMHRLGQEAAARAEETDGTMAGLGYERLGDLVCTQLPDVVVRAYAKPGGETWAAFVQGRFGQHTLDFVTRFEKGAGLTTTRTPGSQDDSKRRDFKSSHPKADPATLHAHHEKRKAELAGKYGPPIPVTASLASFARALEEALKRQLG